MFTKKGFARRSLPAFSVIYLIALILFYLRYLMISVWEISGFTLDFTKYTTAFYIEALTFVIPILLASVMLALCDVKGIKYTLLSTPILLLPCAFYTLISEYIDATMMGASLGEAVLFALLQIIINIVAIYIESIIAFFILKFLTSKFKGSSEQSAAFDFSSKFVKALFLLCVLKFTVITGYEIYSTVTYLIEFSGTYQVSEIIYMMARYFFIFIELFVCHILSFKFKSTLTESYNEYEKEKT